MPVVLTQNEVSLSELDYADVIGEVYEYPARYRTLIQPGERFVYYRGRRHADGSSQTPSYFGCGTIGRVTDTGERYRCTIVDYQPFKRPVPFKSGDFYREPEANSRTAVGFYYQVGVRTIDQHSFDEICEIGLDRPVQKAAALKRPRKPVDVGKLPTSKSADAADEAVQELAIALAAIDAKQRWPESKLFRAPAGQQFSLIARSQKGETRHISVKGTTEPQPLIKLKAAEVTFSEKNASTYSLWVFYELDLQAGTAQFIEHDGAITDHDCDLTAALHGGRLRNAKAGRKVGPLTG